VYPEIGSIGPLTLHSYGLLIALGVFLSLFLMGRAAARDGFPSHEKIFDLVFAVVFSGLLGARLFYVIQEWDWYRQHPFEIFQIWKGGLVYYGGMLLSFAGFFLYVRLVRLPFLASADFTIPFIALTHGFGRVGCFLTGCCFGRGNHPVQLYEAFFNFGLAFFLIRHYLSKRRFTGEITALYLILYPAGRFVIEYFRGDQMPWLMSLTQQQVLSVIFILVGILLYGICRRPR
jgi:phosphatidylglycerol:prolipoprotein diacylglycerol transferase